MWSLVFMWSFMALVLKFAHPLVNEFRAPTLLQEIQNSLPSSCTISLSQCSWKWREPPDVDEVVCSRWPSSISISLARFIQFTTWWKKKEPIFFCPFSALSLFSVALFVNRNPKKPNNRNKTIQWSNKDTRGEKFPLSRSVQRKPILSSSQNCGPVYLRFCLWEAEATEICRAL